MTQAVKSGRNPCDPWRSSRLRKPSGWACQTVWIILPTVERKPGRYVRRCNMTVFPFCEHDRCLGKGTLPRSRSPHGLCMDCRLRARQVRQAANIDVGRGAADQRTLSLEHVACSKETRKASSKGDKRVA